MRVVLWALGVTSAFVDGKATCRIAIQRGYDSQIQVCGYNSAGRFAMAGYRVDIQREDVGPGPQLSLQLETRLGVVVSAGTAVGRFLAAAGPDLISRAAR